MDRLVVAVHRIIETLARELDARLGLAPRGQRGGQLRPGVGLVDQRGRAPDIEDSDTVRSFLRQQKIA